MKDLKSNLLRVLRLKLWIVDRFRPSHWQSTLAWAAAAGAVGALGALAFRFGTEGVHQILTHSASGVVESFRSMPWWGRLTVPALGGLIGGLILLLGRHLTRGQSSADYMEAIVIGDGHIPLRASLVKCATALFSIGSGGSIGREGPMVQLAAVLASLLGRWQRLSPAQLRLLVACGAAAGIASAYNAPIAGAFFVAEIILGSFAMESLGPLVVASVAASLTLRAVSPAHNLYTVPHFSLGSVREMGPYLILGVLVGALAPWFLRTMRLAERAFASRHWPAWFRLMLGGLIVGALAIRVPEVCGNGYSVVLDILNGHITWSALVLVFLCKWLATAASFGSGAPGGVFTPSLFMGAGAGYVFGAGAHALWPAGAIDPQAFALVGMGAFLSASTRAPIMAVILLFEMTLSYDIILPLMACSVVAYYVARGMEPSSIYSEALKRKAAEQTVPEFLALRVSQLIKKDPPRVRVSARFADIARMFLAVRVNNLYVTDDDDRFVGVVSLHDIKPYLGDTDLSRVVIAGDITREDFPHVESDQSLDEALGRFLGSEAERLPVIAKDRSLAGSLAKTDLLLALAERLRVPR